MRVLRPGLCIVGLVALAAGNGCGIGESVSDPCNQVRGSYEYAANKMSGLRSRNASPRTPPYQRATHELARARQALSSCEAESDSRRIPSQPWSEPSDAERKEQLVPEPSEAIETLETRMTAISDTQTNLAGLVEKTARIQSELMSAGFQQFSDAVGEPFPAMSTAAEKLQEIFHDLDIEKNRIRNEL